MGNGVTLSAFLTVTLLWEAQQEDALSDTQRRLLADKANHSARPHVASNWAILDGILRYKNRIYMLKSATMQAEILLRNHNNLHAGHFGAHKPLKLLQRKYFWPRMTEDIKRYVQDCKTCNYTKAACHKPYGLLQLLLAPSGPWKDITIDFITGVPPSLGVDRKAYDAILMVVDRYTKLAKYYPILKTITAEQFSDLLIHTVFSSFDVPSRIVSNQDSIFTITFWLALCHYLCINRRLSTAFHLQTDGQTERQNQTLEQYLHAYVNNQQDNWARLLPMAEYAYNNAVNASTGLTLFKALMGYNLDFDIKMSQELEPASQDAQECIEKLDALRRQLQAS